MSEQNYLNNYQNNNDHNSNKMDVQGQQHNQKQQQLKYPQQSLYINNIFMRGYENGQNQQQYQQQQKLQQQQQYQQRLNNNHNEQQQLQQNQNEVQSQKLNQIIQEQSQRMINKMINSQLNNQYQRIQEEEYVNQDQFQNLNIPNYNHQGQIQQNRSNNAQNQKPGNLRILEEVKNPVSAYMVFVKNWKKDNPDKKMNLSQMGVLFKNLTEQEKIPYIEQYKKQKELYDSYRLNQQINNPNNHQKQNSLNGIFPLHRIKCIMKQDSFYAPKAQAVGAMGKATQYFAQYFLEQIKKMTEGKNRVNADDLYQCIGVKNKVFGFLECLIDQKNYNNNSIVYHEQKQQSKEKLEKMNNTDGKPKTNNKPKISLQIQNEIKQKRPAPIQKSNNKNKIPSNQIKLTDMMFKI